jgi:hypothetical protein
MGISTPALSTPSVLTLTETLRHPLRLQLRSTALSLIIAIIVLCSLLVNVLSTVSGISGMTKSKIGANPVELTVMLVVSVKKTAGHVLTQNVPNVCLGMNALAVYQTP